MCDCAEVFAAAVGLAGYRYSGLAADADLVLISWPCMEEGCPGVRVGWAPLLAALGQVASALNRTACTPTYFGRTATTGVAGYGRTTVKGYERAILFTAHNLIFADNALLPIHLALDPILKHIPRLGKLPNNFVAALCFAVLTKTG